jgi:hypothetical protein
VRHGSWSDWMVIRHLHPVTAGSFDVPVPSPYMLRCPTPTASHSLRTPEDEGPINRDADDEPDFS